MQTKVYSGKLKSVLLSKNRVWRENPLKIQGGKGIFWVNWNVLNFD